MPLPEDLVLGHPLIDAQHRELYEKVEKFQAETRAGLSDRTSLRDFVSFLHDYTVNHFRTEEQLMRELHYPAIWPHEDAHFFFWREVLVMMESCEMMEYSELCGQKVFKIVTEWLKKHVEEEDRALVEWIRAREDGML